MSKQIPAEFLDLFKKPAYAHLATLMPDGSPQVTPVWVGFDETYLLINTTRGRQKERNMQRNVHVAIEIQDPDNPYRYLSVRGKVVEVTEEGAEDNIDELAVKYTGAKYKWREPGQVRIIYKITPEHVAASGN